MTTWNSFITRHTTGNRISPAVTISNQDVIALSSAITWNATMPSGTTLTVETALSLDGGLTWGNWQTCTNGQPVPGIAELDSLEGVRLKIRQSMTTSDVHVTPELHDLAIDIVVAWSDSGIAHGPHKSALTAWDTISLTWKPDRISLVVNDAEAYIENPSLPTSLGAHVYIGADRNGANAINTAVDELRIDKVYRDPETRIAWHKIGSPFYTSEEMKQWPGYMKAESDGLKVYDSQANLRVLLGSWMENLVREYGLYTVGGRIYAGLISTAEPGTTGAKKIDLLPNGQLNVHNNAGGMGLSLEGGAGNASIEFYFDGVYHSTINVSAMVSRPLYLTCSKGFYFSQGVGRTFDIFSGGSGTVEWFANNTIINGTTQVLGSFMVVGGGVKDYVESTENYGLRHLSCTEGPEVKNFDEGRAELVNGECRVEIDPIFLECIEPDSKQTPWLFQLTPMFAGAIYVAEYGPNYFLVKSHGDELLSGAFCWKMTATRKGFAWRRFEEMVIDGGFLGDNWEDDILAELEQEVLDDSVLISGWEDEIFNGVSADE